MIKFGQLARTAMALAALFVLAAGLQAQNSGRFVGSITAISGSTLTVKTDAGEEKQVQVEADAVLKRLAPGQKDLAAAPAIALTDLAVGDRVLVKLDAEATGSIPQASQIVAMKQADLAQKQKLESEDWQKRGVGGLVKSVDAGAGSIVVSSGAGPTAKNVTVMTTKSTTVLRYAAGSVRYEDAKPAGLDAIKPGDQLRARGDKSADGAQVTAEQVISGTFRNVSGMIQSIDAATGAVVVKDLATKKTVTVHILADSQMRRIPERAAQFLAARLKGDAMPAGAWQQRGNGASGGGQAGSQAATPASGQAAGRGPGAAGAGGGFGGAGGGDPQQMLSRLPTIPITDLQKGEAVMVVATDGSTDVNAITLLAGVEPLLEAPAARNLLSNWSMGGGGGAEGAGSQ